MRFVHTADWQLGMTRHFLSAEAQARYSQARLDAIAAVAELARTQGCAFVVVSGDVFESNLLDRHVVVRSLEAMRAFDVPVFLLPGNHDPLNAASVYRSRAFRDHCPEQVRVLDGAAPVRVAGTAVEILAAPWESKQPLEDLVGRACAGAAEPDGTVRVVVGHGAVDQGHPDPDNPALIRLAGLEAALRAGRVDYVALGDRHSVTEVGSTGRVWYAGTPLVTDYDEADPNHALVVRLDGGTVEVERHRTGSWQFLRHAVDLNGAGDVDALAGWLDRIPEKRTTVVKLSFLGTLSLADKARLDAVLDHYRDLLAALETWERHTRLVLRPDDADLRELDLSGFAAEAAAELCRLAGAPGPASVTAQDALGLLYRLVREEG